MTPLTPPSLTGVRQAPSRAIPKEQIDALWARMAVPGVLSSTQLPEFRLHPQLGVELVTASSRVLLKAPWKGRIGTVGEGWGGGRVS
jgi:hypothetical protein